MSGEGGFVERLTKRRARLVGGAVLTGLAWLVLLGALASAAAASPSIVEAPVAFQVTNTDTSLLPCVSNGATYTVRGHITGPQAVFASGKAASVTMYLTGYETGEWTW